MGALGNSWELLGSSLGALGWPNASCGTVSAMQKQGKMKAVEETHKQSEDQLTFEQNHGQRSFPTNAWTSNMAISYPWSSIRSAKPKQNKTTEQHTRITRYGLSFEQEISGNGLSTVFGTSFFEDCTRGTVSEKKSRNMGGPRVLQGSSSGALGGVLGALGSSWGLLGAHGKSLGPKTKTRKHCMRKKQ